MKMVKIKRKSKGEPRNHMKARTTRQIIQNNAELNQFYLNTIVRLGAKNVIGKVAKARAIAITKAFAKQNNIPWVL